MQNVRRNMHTPAAAWHRPRSNDCRRHALRTGRHAFGVAVRVDAAQGTTRQATHTETLKNLSTNKDVDDAGADHRRKEVDD